MSFDTVSGLGWKRIYYPIKLHQALFNKLQITVMGYRQKRVAPGRILVF